jgi:hypothetical protein
MWQDHSQQSVVLLFLLLGHARWCKLQPIGLGRRASIYHPMPGIRQPRPQAFLQMSHLARFITPIVFYISKFIFTFCDKKQKIMKTKVGVPIDVKKVMYL